MSLIELHINGISYSQTENGAYALILSEIEGERKLPIVIGTNEAQSIAIAIEKWNLHKRVALNIIKFTGTKKSRIIQPIEIFQVEFTRSLSRLNQSPDK